MRGVGSHGRDQNLRRGPSLPVIVASQNRLLSGIAFRLDLPRAPSSRKQRGTWVQESCRNAKKRVWVKRGQRGRGAGLGCSARRRVPPQKQGETLSFMSLRICWILKMARRTGLPCCKLAYYHPNDAADTLPGYECWSAAFEQLRAKAEQGEEVYLDVYGATNPAEFFAVATEAFFEWPHEMRANNPELYAELKRFYRQDPVQWTPASQKPDNVAACMNRGAAKQARGDLDGALADNIKAISITTGDASI